jgi:hypothetical protein
MRESQRESVSIFASSAVLFGRIAQLREDFFSLAAQVVQGRLVIGYENLGNSASAILRVWLPLCYFALFKTLRCNPNPSNPSLVSEFAPQRKLKRPLISYLDQILE